MFGTTDLALFVVSGLLLNITLGPDTLYILSRTASHRCRGGTVAALGVGAGLFVHTLAAIVGLSALLAASATAFTMLKWIGRLHAHAIINGLEPDHSTPLTGATLIRPQDGVIDAADRIAYRAIDDRPVIRWPNGARLALCVVPNVEHYEYLPPPHAIRNAYPRTPHPDVFSYGAKDYGNRAGLWRMFDVLDKYRIRATASLNIGVIELYPEVFAACEARQWDYMGHGMYNTRYMWGVSEEEEREHIRACVDLYRKRTGRQLMGWLSPALSHTLLTPDLVAEAGIRYLCDLVHDDQPWPIRVRSGRLISFPYSVDLNDAVTHRQGYEAEDFARMVVDTFDTLWREGAASGRVMSIAVHPYNMGQPHRIRHLDAALAHIMRHDGVWVATGTEISDWYYAHIWDQVAPLAKLTQARDAG